MLNRDTICPVCGFDWHEPVERYEVVNAVEPSSATTMPILTTSSSEGGGLSEGARGQDQACPKWMESTEATGTPQ